MDMLFFARSAGALACHTRMRAGFPREPWIAPTMARDRFPRTYGNARRFFGCIVLGPTVCSSGSPDPERSRSGDLDLQAWRANDGEG